MPITCLIAISNPCILASMVREMTSMAEQSEAVTQLMQYNIITVVVLV